MKKLKKTEGGMYCFLVTFDPTSEVLNVVDLNAPSQVIDANQSSVIESSSPPPESTAASIAPTEEVTQNRLTLSQPQETKTELKLEDKELESKDLESTSAAEASRDVPRKSRPPKPRRDYSPNDLLSRQEAAEYLGVAEQTLAVWKCTGRYDLPYVKIGKLVKYKKVDLDRFIDGTKHGPLDWKKKS